MQKGDEKMEKEYRKAIYQMTEEEVIQLRIFMDAIMRQDHVSAKDRYTDAPAALHPQKDCHNPE